jgi:signal transduction histidine kinase
VTSLSPWLALDSATSPAARARELRREWEQFIGGSRVNGVRVPVADSWRRSLEAGVDPSGKALAPTVVDRTEAFDLWGAHPLAGVAPLIRHCLTDIALEADHLVVVSDAFGLLLQLEGDAQVRSRAADSMNFTEGALWSESGAGTNAIGTAIAADHAVQVFASEHFVEVVQAWTCSAAPVHDPDSGELLGVIDLTGLQKDVHPHSLAVATTAAKAVESHLAYRLTEQDEALRARHEWCVTGAGERRALVAPSGRLVADDSRGWLGGARLDLPSGEGEVVLPSGESAWAEPVGHGEAFLVRELDRARARRRTPHDEPHALLEEHAALRRLATAVARGVPPDQIFAAVAEELRPLLGADDAAVVRFERDGTSTLLAGADLRVDDVVAITDVLRTGRSVRMGSAAASPIVVDGGLWGAILASTRNEPLPPDTQERMADFTELVAIVIANAESRAELSASRARVMAAGDEARRRIQRDLHDGAQARLVSTVLALKVARQKAGRTSGPLADLLDEALAHAERAKDELRELAHGILPVALSRGGLSGGVDSLVSRIDLPVSLDVTADRLPAALEATAYFILAEALTNAVKHAGATSARIVAAVEGGALRLEVHDDGIGGASINGSTGLLGLRDRAAALGGELWIESPRGKGTAISAILPIAAAEAA